MGHTLILEVPEEVYEPLFRKAKQTGETPEKIVAVWLANAVKSLTDDPLLQLAGVFASDATDVSERHDEYIGQGLMKELHRSKDG
jgi:hypothetical protein